MSVRFILGRSGTGKTRYCIRGIVDALAEAASSQPLVLLVPEQATYQAERAILCQEGVAGYNRLHVLSFERLQFLLLGKNTARHQLSQVGRQMVIHRILRRNQDKLKAFGLSAVSPGLSQQMAETIIELHRYAKTADDVDELLEKLNKDSNNKLTALKFADIGLIFKEYLKAIESRFTDPDIQLTRASKAVGDADFIKGARLWVDGFAGFTTSEFVMLAEVLKAAEDAEIAFCLDPSEIDLKNPRAEPDPTGLFSPTQRTYAELVGMVKKCKLSPAEPVILEEPIRFSASEQLAHVEREIFGANPRRIEASDNIRIVSAPNVRDEVQFVAREILRLVRDSQFRYRDIAVIASDIDSCRHYIRAYFEDYRIPYFIDRRRPLGRHPLVQLICCALRIVGEGFPDGDIFAYLKTDLVPVDSRDCDLLENYSVAFGIRGDDWQSRQQWRFAGRDDEGFDEPRVNRIRAAVARPLLRLRDELFQADQAEKTLTADEFTRIIFDFLETLGIRRSLGEWVEEAVLSGDHTTAEEHRQCYDKLVDIFDELVEVFAGRRMSCSDFAAIIDSAFSQMTLAFIPPTLDQVLVGSIERSRHPDLKAVFLIGATQRQFPAPVGFESILTDDDRAVADEFDFALAPSVRETLTQRQYLAYIAFTRASRFLCVTYPSCDEKGGSTVRSQFVDSLESLFEGLDEESCAGQRIDVENVYSEAELVDLLCSELGRDPAGKADGGEMLEELLNDMCADEALGNAGAKVRSAVNYENRAQVDDRMVESLFTMRIKSSPTRLSTFAACPYRHFAGYVLQLKKRQEFKFEPLDVGWFYHTVLDRLLKKLNSEGQDLGAVRDSALMKLLKEQIAEHIDQDAFISNFVRHGPHNAFVINSAAEVLEDCVADISRMVRAGRFRPKESEILFEGHEFPLSGKRCVVLRGKIDRLDIAETENGKVAVVFDYKRRSKTFDWSRFYHGLDMQLPLYMLAVRCASDLRGRAKSVVGGFYMPVEVSPGKGSFAEGWTEVTGFERKAKGIFYGEFSKQLDAKADSGWSAFYNFSVTKNDDQYGYYGKSGALKPGDFEKVLRYCEQKTIQLAEEIVSGKIDVAPYRLGNESPCSYCDYRPVCRFDWQVNDHRVLERRGKRELLAEAEVADG